MRKFIICLLIALLPIMIFAGGGRNRVVDSELIIKPVRGAIEIDGKLDEWTVSEASLLTPAFLGGIAGHGAAYFDRYNAKVALKYDKDNLYVGIWWKDPTPLGYDLTPGTIPAVDGVILSVNAEKKQHLALWKIPGIEQYKALVSIGDTPLSQGKPVAGIDQKCVKNSEEGYTQEIKIPWKVLGLDPSKTTKLRLGIELCFGGMDASKGYQAWVEENLKYKTSGNRWGGNLCWGGVDGIKSRDQLTTSFDPNTGALVKLMDKGAKAPANPPVLYRGNEHTRTTEMIAVPAENIVIDGLLDEGEWAPESQTVISFESSLFPKHYETGVYWAYNDKGLYVGLRWYTKGQQININNPKLINRGYDGGDAIQIRLATDKVSHLDAWCYTPAWQPAMNIAYGAKFNEGTIPDALTNVAQMAFQPCVTGGYTQEIFLTWKLITKTGKPLQKGDQFRTVLDLFYSGMEQNRIAYIINSTVAEPGGVVDIPFKAPRDGFYTVIIENADGENVRRLLEHEKLQKGQEIAEWDGLDNEGKPVAAGAYRFRGLYDVPQMKNFLQWAVILLTPPTPGYKDMTTEMSNDSYKTLSKKRRIAPIGDHAHLGPSITENFVLMAEWYREREPECAQLLRWAFHVAGADGKYHGNPLLFFINANEWMLSCPEREFVLPSRRLEGFGAVIRGNQNKEQESYLLLKLGPGGYRYHNTEGSFIFFADGKPLIYDGGEAGETWRHSTLSFYDTHTMLKPGHVERFADFEQIGFTQGISPRALKPGQANYHNDSCRPESVEEGYLDYHEPNPADSRSLFWVKNQYLVVHDALNLDGEIPTHWHLQVVGDYHTGEINTGWKFKGRFGTDLQVLMIGQDDAEVKIEQTAILDGRPAEERFSMRHLEVSGKKGTDNYLAVLRPLSENQDPLQARAIKRSDTVIGIEINGPDVNDRLFFSRERIQYTADDTVFNGRYAAVLQRESSLILNLLDGELLSYQGITISSDGPAVILNQCVDRVEIAAKGQGTFVIQEECRTKTYKIDGEIKIDHLNKKGSS